MKKEELENIYKNLIDDITSLDINIDNLTNNKKDILNISNIIDDKPINKQNISNQIYYEQIDKQNISEKIDKQNISEKINHKSINKPNILNQVNDNILDILNQNNIISTPTLENTLIINKIHLIARRK